MFLNALSQPSLILYLNLYNILYVVHSIISDTDTDTDTDTDAVSFDTTMMIHHHKICLK